MTHIDLDELESRAVCTWVPVKSDDVLALIRAVRAAQDYDQAVAAFERLAVNAGSYAKERRDVCAVKLAALRAALLPFTTPREGT